MTAQEKTSEPHCPMCGSTATKTKFLKIYGKQHWFLRWCTKCGLHFTNPQPTPSFLSQSYHGDYHLALRAKGATEKRFGAKFQRYLNCLSAFLPSGSRVLDIGCSTGLLLKMLCDQGYRAEGIELNQQSAQWGRRHYKVTIHEKKIEDCSFAPESLDAVVLADVLEHMPHPLNYLIEVRKYLTPNGIALVTFPDVTSLESWYFLLLARLTHRPWLWRNCHIPLHVWEFTKKTALKCFKQAGFQVLYFGRSHEAVVVDKRESRLFKLINMPPKVFDLPFLSKRLGTQMEFIIRKS